MPGYNPSVDELRTDARRGDALGEAARMVLEERGIPIEQPRFIVTIKLPRNLDHDPRNKRTGVCLLSPLCTDVTGEHHSVLVHADDADAARIRFQDQGHHVTRVEQVAG